MISRSLHVCSIIGVVGLMANGGFLNLPLFPFPEIPTRVDYLDPFSVQHHSPRSLSFTMSPQQISIADLVENSHAYHQQVVSVQGQITQPELHLDDTELFLDFVFRLSQGQHSIVVYGRHDRTRGAPPIIMNHSVEVIGTFWEEQDRQGTVVFNVLESISVTPYPSSIPRST